MRDGRLTSNKVRGGKDMSSGGFAARARSAGSRSYGGSGGNTAKSSGQEQSRGQKK